MSNSIESIPVLTRGNDEFKARWGTSVYDYKLDNVTIDLQDMLVTLTEQRAAAVEKEVEPLTNIIKKRNTRLDQLSNALSQLTQAQGSFDKDSTPTTWAKNVLTADVVALLRTFNREIGVSDSDITNGDSGKFNIIKRVVDAYIEKVKKVMDGLNNENQMAMNRLQSLVDKRDESHTAASELMKSVSGTRDTVIKNL